MSRWRASEKSEWLVCYWYSYVKIAFQATAYNLASNSSLHIKFNIVWSIKRTIKHSRKHFTGGIRKFPYFAGDDLQKGSTPPPTLASLLIPDDLVHLWGTHTRHTTQYWGESGFWLLYTPLLGPAEWNGWALVDVVACGDCSVGEGSLRWALFVYLLEMFLYLAYFLGSSFHLYCGILIWT